MKWIALAVLFLLSLSVSASPPPVPRRSPLATRTNAPLDDSNRVILVKFKSKTVASPLIVDLPGKSFRFEPVGQRLRWHQHVVPPGQDKHETIKQLKGSGLFEHVMEPLVYRTQDTIPNDPTYHLMWGLSNIQANLAWDTIRVATNIIVAVVDTGIDFKHLDLKDNLWSGPSGEHGYVATNGIVIPGGEDDLDHGTHVAGTIAAVGNNGLGVVGMAWRARLMAIKVLHHGSGNSLDIANGILKLVELKESGVPVFISNHSYGAKGVDPLMRDAFEELSNADILAAVAAGNSNLDNDINPFQPAGFSFANMIVVTASDQANKKAAFSSFGLIGTDIAAPGVSILSTVRGNGATTFSGTSMASPHVAGVALLLRSLNPQLSARQIRDIILHPDSYDASTNFWQNNTSAKLNANKAVNNMSAPENHFPVVQVTPVKVITDSTPRLITATASDQDADSLRWLVNPPNTHNYIKQLTTRNGLVVQASDNAAVVAGNPFAYQYAGDIQFSVSDNRGGGASTNSGFEFMLERSRRKPISVKTWTARTNLNIVSWVFDVADESKTNYSYILIVHNSFAGFSSFIGLTPSTNEIISDLGMAARWARVFVMDKHLNYLQSEPIFFTGQTNTPCPVTISTNEGNIPFSVSFSVSTNCILWTGDFLNNRLAISSGILPMTVPGMVLASAMTVDRISQQVDLTLHPIFASRFLGVQPEPSTLTITMLLEGADTVTGPWVSETNAPVIITTDKPKRFYRTRATIAQE